MVNRFNKSPLKTWDSGIYTSLFIKLPPLLKGGIINMFHIADMEWVRVCNKK